MILCIISNYLMFNVFYNTFILITRIYIGLIKQILELLHQFNDAVGSQYPVQFFLFGRVHVMYLYCVLSIGIKWKPII